MGHSDDGQHVNGYPILEAVNVQGAVLNSETEKTSASSTAPGNPVADEPTQQPNAIIQNNNNNGLISSAAPSAAHASTMYNTDEYHHHDSGVPINITVLPPPTHHPNTTGNMFNTTGTDERPLLHSGDNIPLPYPNSGVGVMSGVEVSPQTLSTTNPILDEEFAALMSYRSQSQLRLMRGSDKVIWPTTVALILIFCYAYHTRGLAGLLLLPISLLPSFVYLLALRRNHAREISVPLLFEMFWAGAILSMLSALTLEAVAIERAGMPTDDAVPWSAIRYLRTVIIAIVCIGFAEEISKIMPMALVKTRERDIPYTCTLFFRYVDSPYAYVISGAACAAGFAAVENVSYVFKGDALEVSLVTSVVRAMLSVPFHIACTTFVAARYAYAKFHVDDADNFEDNASLGNLEMAPRSSPMMIPLNTGLLQPPWLPPITYSTTLTLWSYFLPLAIAAALHGGFDSALLIAAKVAKLNHMSGDDDGGTVRSSSTSTAHPTTTSDVPNDVEVFMLIATAMACALSIFILSVTAWARLKRLPNPSVRLARYYQQNDLVGAAVPVFQSGNVVAPSDRHGDR
eukprot:Lankesteria_metandrocarpae@DN478_c0_g1_i1.p1